MALSIVRHDITKIQADAIVNSTNEYFVVGGLGVDASIHYAAGPELQNALDEIGHCPVGSAVITESFHIPTCRYIIHAVAPVYRKAETPKERMAARKLLYSTYLSVLDLASKKRCRSVAIPLLSAGANRHPEDDAYHIATECIRGWLSHHFATEMEIILVLFDRNAVDISQAYGSSPKEYITDHYAAASKEELSSYYGRPYPRSDRVTEDTVSFDAIYDAGISSEHAFPVNAAVSFDHYADLDLSFGDMCEWWRQKKGMKKGQFFSASNITKSTFSNMRLHPDRAPKKSTALACAIGLRLDYDQANDLLMRAGMTFSKHFPLDRYVAECIRDGKYDIDEINLALYEMDLPLLGYSKA